MASFVNLAFLTSYYRASGDLIILRNCSKLVEAGLFAIFIVNMSKINHLILFMV